MKQSPKTSSSPIISMIKLNLEIQVTSLAYRRRHAEPHFIIFSIEGQDDDLLHYEQRFLQKNEVYFEFDREVPLPLFIIIGPQKITACPFRFCFTSKLKEPIKRVIPLAQKALLNYYFTHDIFEDIKPFEQTYSFQSGKLEFCIHMKAQKLQDVDDVERYNALFKDHPSSRVAFGSQPSCSRTKNKEPSILDVLQQKKLSDQQLESPTFEPRLRSKMTSLYNMSVQQIVDKMDEKQKKFKKKEPSAISRPKSTFLSHKLGRRKLSALRR